MITRLLDADRDNRKYTLEFDTVTLKYHVTYISKDTKRKHICKSIAIIESMIAEFIISGLILDKIITWGEATEMINKLSKRGKKYHGEELK